MSGNANARLQIVLRGVLVAFVLATVIAVALAHNSGRWRCSST